MRAILPIAATSGLVLLLGVGAAQARNDEHHLPYSAVLDSESGRFALGPDMAFYVGGAQTPPVVAHLGEVTAEQKVHTGKRPDEEACNEAALVALTQLAKKARAQGANGIINVSSFYRRGTGTGGNTYECHSGHSTIVQLRAEAVTLGPGGAPVPPPPTAYAPPQSGAYVSPPRPAAPATRPAPRPAAAHTTEKPDDPTARLKQLKSLHDQSLITDEEYATRRKAIVDGL